MKFRVSKIGHEGLHKEYDLGVGWFEKVLGEEYMPQTEAKGRAVVDLQRTGATLTVSGRVEGHFHVPCSRCLEAARVDVGMDFVFVLEKRADELSDEMAEEVELSEEDLSFATYVGDEVDLLPLVREQFVLAIPIAPLCRDDCWPASFDGVVESVDEGGPSSNDGDTAKNIAWKDSLARLKDEMAREK